MSMPTSMYTFAVAPRKSFSILIATILFSIGDFDSVITSLVFSLLSRLPVHKFFLQASSPELSVGRKH